MRYYHFSKLLYQVGDSIGPFPVQSNFYGGKAVAEGHGWIDELLNQAAPKGMQFNRNNCVYLFREKAHCYHFAKMYPQSQESDKYYLYQVDPTRPHRCLMSAIGLFTRRENFSEETGKLAKEYWNPSENYTYSEHLCGSAKVSARFGPNIRISTTEETDVDAVALSLSLEKKKIIQKLGIVER